MHAAIECFAECGFAATKLEDVAARVDVSKEKLYLYYENKEELFKAVVRGELVPNIVKIEKISGRKYIVGRIAAAIAALGENFHQIETRAAAETDYFRRR